MIVYKVVNHNRESCVGTGKYLLKYPKGKIVKAKSWTLGVMCFDTIESASEFAGGLGRMVIKVKGIGQLSRPKFIINWCRLPSVLKKTYDSFLNTTNFYYQENIVCYPAVEVLE